MLPEDLRQTLRDRIDRSEHPREAAVDVMFILQKHYGYLSDEALRQGADLLGMTPLELEEIATFYDFVYREPVGKNVIHACDGVVCWMRHSGWEKESVIDYLCRTLGVQVGETSADGLFTVLPSACLGRCDSAPAVLINGVPYGYLTPERIDEILEQVRQDPGPGEVRR